jgi:hypothetical protein
MRDFDDELRERLGRTAADAPRPEGMPEEVRSRARRRRVANTALTGVVVVGLAFGGFVGVRAAMDQAAPVAEQRPAGQSPVPGPSPSPSPSPEPTVEPTPTSPPEPPADLVCDETEGGNDQFHPDFLNIVTLEGVSGGEGSVGDAVTFLFRPMEGQTEPPRYFIATTDQLLTDGEGAPVDVRGEAFVAVSFFARGVELSGEEVIPIYTGRKEILVDGVVVRELEQTGDFEGMVSWGIGLAEESCFTVDAGPDHLTLMFSPDW